ncbi:hypothetical protein OIE67_02235 [Nonomuraea fuscirosea]|uniref:hypothetical protein n=1 Tax=Nonomuraea fuscirosea TaxID=1291556 RepID=UPI002DDB927D|nr:hypothetical protein [Nonomuraea fuscirosea]WSA53485.1 hypothetical protein OIE67_02235 [Nonomuraea fuscirosea]
MALVIYCGDGLTERLTADVWVNGRQIRGRLGTPIPDYRRRSGTLTVAAYDGSL